MCFCKSTTRFGKQLLAWSEKRKNSVDVQANFLASSFFQIITEAAKKNLFHTSCLVNFSLHQSVRSSFSIPPIKLETFLLPFKKVPLETRKLRISLKVLILVHSPSQLRGAGLHSVSATKGGLLGPQLAQATLLVFCGPLCFDH